MLDKIKQLTKDTAVYGISTIVGRFLNFLLVPLYTNIFLPEEYGIQSQVYVFISMKLIDWQTAITRVPADQLDQVLAPVFDRAAVKSAKAIATGLPAGPGAATGRIYFNADRCVEAAAKGQKVLLVRVETSPEDLRGMIAAEGILTARGGVSSHAALVARQMGKVCVCGASALEVNYDKRTLTVGGQTFNEGDFLSIDGTAGTVYAGELKTAAAEVIQGLVEGDAEAKKSRTA